MGILGYRVENGTVRPDFKRLPPLLGLPPPNNTKLLKRMLRLLELFAFYAKWVINYFENIVWLKSVTSFLLKSQAEKKIDSLKQDIANAFLQAIDKNASLLTATPSTWLSLQH